MMNAQNPAGARVVVLSGPSGSGKSTLVNRLMESATVKLCKAVSATTRPPRKGEIHGEDYYFLTPEEFAARRARDEFLECEEVHGAGYWYGTLKSELARARDAGAWAFLEIDVQGALKVMDAYPDAVSIFVSTSSVEDYERRLRSRGTESDDVIRRRLATASKELQFADRYRYRVVNDNLDRAVEEISNILTTWEAELNAR
jgi:guanylate kinase